MTGTYSHPLIEYAARAAYRRHARKLRDPDDYLQRVRIRAWRLAARRPDLDDLGCWRLAGQVADREWQDYARGPRPGRPAPPKVASLDAIRDRAADAGEAWLTEPAAPADPVGWGLEYQEAVDRLAEAIPASCRELFRLYFGRGLSVTEIGRHFGVCPSRISIRLAPARFALHGDSRRSLAGVVA